MEDWQEKTVSMGNVDMEEFDTDLAHVRVSENRIHVEFRDHDDWKRIRREVGDDKILREVEWREVEDVDAATEHLYFMHIDLEVADPDDEDGTVEKRVYFLEDDEEAMEDCLSAIRRFWNAWRQKQAVPSGDYSYSDAGAEAGGDEQEDVDLAEAARDGADEDGDDADDSEDEDDGAADTEQDETETGDDEDRETGNEDDAGEEDTDEDSRDDEDAEEDDRGIEDIVKDFLP